MQFRDFLLILRARWMTVLTSVLVVLGAAAAVTLTTTPIYTSKARVYLAAEGRSANDPNASNGTYIITIKDLNTYVAVLGSPDVLDPIRQQLDLPPGTPIDVSAEVSETASILDITARSSDPKLAADIANAVGPQLARVAGKFSTLLASAGQQVASRTISPATPAATPTSPDTKVNLLLGVLLGLVAGVGLAFVRHTVDTKVRDDKDVTSLSRSPLLGRLPMEKAATGRLLTVEGDPHGHHAEAIRRLRTNLMFVDVTTGGHSFVVTSSMPGEGKTTTAVNLAMAVADAGSKVLLIDADLRNPSVARTLGLEGSVGLTTILLGRATAEDVVQRWRDSNLFVLAAGQIPPNPSELLGSEPMEELFVKLRHDYDFILIDSPPVVPVIDAVIVDRLTGGLLMVVAVDRTKKRDLSSALKSLDTVGVKVSGFTLNMTPVKSSQKYRYGYHRYEAEAARSRASRRRSRRAAASRG
ncbi:MAG TPA: polysaccharide biosynthesis tyrosine autokinase [Dermatophilaceae bacterium]|nr:polysaccharide biosynthesis tyrosine autokinase [Dermatophilaceae bacterium]